MAGSSTAASQEEHNRNDGETKLPENWLVQIEASNTVTKPIAAQLLQQMGLDRTRTETFKLLDHSCGTGVTGSVLRETIAREVLEKSSILSADISPEAVEIAKRRQSKEGWVNSGTRVLDAQKTDLPDGSFTHISVGMGLHITPDPDGVIKDCIRLLQPGGTFGLTTPSGPIGIMVDVCDAFESFPFDAPHPDPAVTQLHDKGHWADHNWVRRHLESHGLQDVQVSLHMALAPVAGGAEFVRLYEHMIDMVRSWWPEATRAAHPKEEVLGLVREYAERKYEGRDWLARVNALVATGRKKAE